MDRSNSDQTIFHNYNLFWLLPFLFICGHGYAADRSLKREFLIKQIELDSWDAESRLSLAQEEFKAGKFESAWRISNQAILLEPSHSGLNALRCRILFEQKRWGDLLVELEKRSMPVEPEFQFFRAKALFNLGRFEDSFAVAKSLSKAANGQSFHPQYLSLLGDLAFDGYSGEDFLSYYQKSYEIEPENREFQFKLGRAYFKLNKINQAKIFFERLEEFGYELDDYRYAYLQMLERGLNYSKMGSLLSRWNFKTGGKTWVLASLVRLEFKVGKAEIAQKRIDEILRVHAQVPEVVSFFTGIGDGILQKAPQTEKLKYVEKEPERVVEKIRVRKGDSLQLISKRLYGTSKRWKSILELNPKLNSRAGKAKNLLKVGMWINVMTVRRSIANAPEEVATVDQAVEAESEHNSAPVEKEESILVSPQDAAALPPFLGEGKESSETSTQELSGVPEAAEFTIVDEIEKENSPREARNSANAEYGFYSMDHSLQGQGFTASLKPNSGYKLQGGISIGIKRSSAIEVIVSNGETTYEGLTTLSPRTILVKDSSLSAGFGFVPVPDISTKLKFSAHWCLKERTATNSSPNLPVASYKANGPCAQISYGGKIYQKLQGSAGAGVFFPYKYAEKTRATGSYESSLMLSLYGKLSYPVAKILNVYSGVQYSAQRVSFKGSGDRSVRDAEEKSTALNIPIGVEVNF